MQCDVCSKKKATVHLTEIVDEQMSEMHLCEECARNKSAQMEQQFGLGDLLAGLSDTGKGTVKLDDKTALICSGCGLNYEDFRKFGRLGCGKCFTSFKEHLEGLLRKIHGSNRHLGKIPYALLPPGEKPKAVAIDLEMVATQAPVENIGDLKKYLQDAIMSEDFEKAAMLRDKIKMMEKKS